MAKKAPGTTMLLHLCLSLWATCIGFASAYAFHGSDQATMGDGGSKPAAAPLLLELTRRVTDGNTTRVRRAPLPLEKHAENFFLDMRVGGQLMKFHVDTGSQTFWAARSNFKCYNSQECRDSDANEVPQHECRLANVLYQANNFQPIGGAPFCQTYGSGEWAAGELGHDQVLVDGRQFNAVLGAATKAGVDGDEMETGILGLAASGYVMGDKRDHHGQRFSGFFPQLVTAVGIQNMFSLALSRDASPSWLELGGRLDQVQTTGGVGRTALFTIQAPMVPGGNFPGFGGDLVGDYVITVDGYKINGEAVEFDEPDLHTMLDSGSPYITVPGQVALEFNRIWVPEEDDIWETRPEVPCELSEGNPPSLSITIGGVDFTIDRRDLVERHADGKCFSTLQGSVEKALLGTTFFKNVVVVHDLETRHMEIRQRSHY